MKTKVFIRVDAHKNMGMGHWVRCTALANMLKEKMDCIFITKTKNETLIKELSNKGIECILLPSYLSFLEEAAFIKEQYLSGREIIVLDGYAFEKAYQKILKKGAGKIVCIDDLHQCHFVADAIINHAGGISSDQYSKEKDTQLFLGLEFLLLRNQFLNHRNNKRIRSNSMESVLICLGGEDPKNDVLKVLSICEGNEDIKTGKVILGRGYRYKSHLKEICANSRLNITILQDLSPEEMVSAMEECDTAIFSPSTVALEYLSIGGNLFLYPTADNQKDLCQFLIQENLAFPFETMGWLFSTQLEYARKNQQHLIDGKSPERILKIFESLDYDMKCCFRRANRDDLLQYYKWANEKETRKQSFSSEKISLQQHQAWFKEQLEDKQSCLIVMEYFGKPAGQVRFKLSCKQAVLSYSIDKNYRGLGLAKTLLEGAIIALRKQYPNINTIEGYVKNNNIPSKKVFQGLGFSKTEIKPQQQIKYFQSIQRVG